MFNHPCLWQLATLLYIVLMQQDPGLELRLRALESELAEARSASGRAKPSRTRKLLAITATCLALVGIGGASYFYMQPSKDSPQIDATSVIYAQKSKPYTLFFPSQLPQGFRFDPATVSNQQAFVSYSLLSPAGNNLVVTQQQRPPVMERVKLVGNDTKQDLTNGTHIADMEGDYTGIILTDETLVIVSGSQKKELEQLKLLLDSFKAV